MDAPDTGPRSHDPHEPDRLVRREAVLVNQVGADQGARPSEPGLAVHRHHAAFDNDLVTDVDEFADHRHGRVGPVVKVH